MLHQSSCSGAQETERQLSASCFCKITSIHSVCSWTPAKSWIVRSESCFSSTHSFSVQNLIQIDLFFTLCCNYSEGHTVYDRKYCGAHHSLPEITNLFAVKHMHHPFVSTLKMVTRRYIFFQTHYRLASIQLCDEVCYLLTHWLRIWSIPYWKSMNHNVCLLAEFRQTSNHSQNVFLYSKNSKNRRKFETERKL